MDQKDGMGGGTADVDKWPFHQVAKSIGILVVLLHGLEDGNGDVLHIDLRVALVGGQPHRRREDVELSQNLCSTDASLSLC